MVALTLQLASESPEVIKNPDSQAPSSSCWLKRLRGWGWLRMGISNKLLGLIRLEDCTLRTILFHIFPLLRHSISLWPFGLVAHSMVPSQTPFYTWHLISQLHLLLQEPQKMMLRELLHGPRHQEHREHAQITFQGSGEAHKRVCFPSVRLIIRVMLLPPPWSQLDTAGLVSLWIVSKRINLCIHSAIENLQC